MTMLTDDPLPYLTHTMTIRWKYADEDGDAALAVLLAAAGAGQ